jgi:hypothetical protein
MAQLDRADIHSALPRKGFECDERDQHTFFHLYVDGRRTGIKTFTSRGSSYKTYGDSLLGKMAQQLHITKGQLVDLVGCTIDGAGLLVVLRASGIAV